MANLTNLMNSQKFVSKQQGSTCNKTRGPLLQVANLMNPMNVANLPNLSASNKAVHITRQEAPFASSKYGKFDESGKCGEFTKFVTKQQGNLFYFHSTLCWLVKEGMEC